MRHRLFAVIEPGSNHNAGDIYETMMLLVIIVSLLPLCFKIQTDFMIWLDKAAVTLFAVDYLLRFVTADLRYPKLKGAAFAVYPFTPWALADLLSILPSMSLINSGFRLLRVLRLLRTLRVIRFLRHSKSLRIIVRVLRSQKESLLAVCYMAAVYIFLTALIMFVVEPDSFENIFVAIYWATTSLTTVGYGDIYPVTDLGRLVSMISSVVGIAVVALPAGIISVGYVSECQKR